EQFRFDVGHVAANRADGRRQDQPLAAGLRPVVAGLSLILRRMGIHCRTVASLRPRPMNIAPATLLSTPASDGRCRIALRSVAAPTARAVHQIDPRVTNVSPSTRKAPTLWVLEAEMNCGIRARKNNPTLGLSRLVMMPWRNAG